MGLSRPFEYVSFYIPLNTTDSLHRLPTYIHGGGCLPWLSYPKGFLCRNFLHTPQYAPLSFAFLFLRYLGTSGSCRETSDCIRIPRFFAQRGSWGIRPPKTGHLTPGTTLLGLEKGIDRFIRLRLLEVCLQHLRKCPGMHLIHSSLWLVIARVVATFDIKKKVVNGVPVEMNVKEKNAFFR